ncbi:MAG TPA: cytochrome d ubiquinol oxidase subunit II [Solirubrobacterales bacterium]|nr:cytochrome d ubiquinol oxidase subunit II [Solirubrobacterales bacterium]
MSLAEIPILLILFGLAAYVVLGGADFGAGFWELTARGEGAERLRDHTHRAMAPVWEANHVWLVFVLVICWTAYPEAFGSIFSTLAAPLLLAALGIVLRGAGYVVRSVGETRWGFGLFSVSSVLTPFALGAAIGGIASGRVPVGNAEGDLISSWLNPTSMLIGVLAVAFSAYTAAVFLAGDAARRGDRSLVGAFRGRAVVAGAVAGLLALGGLAVLHGDAEHLYEGLTEGAGLAAVLVSALAGIATLFLVRAERFEPARYTAAVAVAAIVAGWGLAQSPEILPGLTITEAAASRSTLVATLLSVAVGLAVLLPSLSLLFGLTLRGRFDPGAAREEAAPAAGGARARPPAELAFTVAAGAVGAALTFLLEGGIAQAIGIVALLAAVGWGFVLLADPRRLTGAEGPEAS